MKSPSYIELSQNALQSNINFIRGIVGPECRVSSVIKGNAYGHGIDVFVPMAQRCGIDHFSVFSAEEAYKTHQIVSPGTAIMIMGQIDPVDLEWVIENEI